MRGLTFLPLVMLLVGGVMLYAGLTGKSKSVIKALQ